MSNAVEVLDSYSIEVTRRITVGAMYHLAPSEVYQGIVAGNVKIDAILHPQLNMDARTKSDSVDIWVDSVSSDDDIDNNDLVTHYNTCLWVQYSYLDKVDCYMPLDLFAQHCVPRY